MQTVTENITPAKAQEYLNTSEGNRPISKVYVRSYADTMRKGNWMLNGIPIIFDTNGHLLDGHHRLLAVVEAGIPIRFDVCRGASPEAFTTYDTGRHRTIGQILGMQKVKNYNLVGSIVNANETLTSQGRLIANNSNPSTRRTLSDGYDAFCKDPDGYCEAAAFIGPLHSSLRIIPGSWAGGLYYFLLHSGGYSRQEVDPFFECLFSYGSQDIPSAFLLQSALSKLRLGSDTRRIDEETLWVYIVKAWNAYIDPNKTLKKLAYDKSKERIPALILR